VGTDRDRLRPGQAAADLGRGRDQDARERRSPSLCEIWTMTRSKSTEIGCLSSSTAGVSDLALVDPFFVVDVGT
jgi:hypothetical protein